MIPRRNPLCSDELLYGPILAQQIPTLWRRKIHCFCVEKFGQTHFFYVCFNDRCPYYIRGWEHVWAAQQIHASFRCRLDPDSGKWVPLPVWSAEALKEDIIDA